MRTTLLSIIASLSLCATMEDARARDSLRVVGSSTVYPFATAVGEALTKKGFPPPRITSTTSGAGMKRFCDGTGTEFPDIAPTSRPISAKEVALCEKNAVAYTEIKVGNDANVLIYRTALGALRLTGEQLWRAVAAQVPIGGTLVANPYKTWDEIDPSLPATAIQVFGPPVGAGVRDGLTEQYILPACLADTLVTTMPADQAKEICTTFRADGTFVEFEKAAEVMLALLEADIAVGMTSYSLVTAEAKQSGIVMATIDGVAPSRDTVATGEYTGSQSLFIYLKPAHFDAVPGIRDFAAEFVSDAAAGADGYLVDLGLVPLTDSERRKMQEQIASLASPD